METENKTQQELLAIQEEQNCQVAETSVPVHYQKTKAGKAGFFKEFYVKEEKVRTNGKVATKWQTKEYFNRTYMKDFYSEADKNKAKEWFHPADGIALAIRYKEGNRLLEKMRTNGIKQFISFGCGYETRSQVEDFGDGKYYEIDLPPTLKRKETIFTEKYGKDPDFKIKAKYIPADYKKPDIMEKLEEAGVDFDAPTVFFFEGGATYMDAETLLNFFKKIKKTFTKQVFIYFDYMLDTVYKVPEVGQLLKTLPNVHVFNNMEKLVEEAGFVFMEKKKIRDVTLADGIGTEPEEVQGHSVLATIATM